MQVLRNSAAPEIGLAEFSHREQVGLLAYSPLAFGVLTGKYAGGARPPVESKEFSDAHLPKLPPHWKRDYFFYADGFVKDMDFYEALPFTVSQIPFHGMSIYPYPNHEQYPETETTLGYRLGWNDRFETGDRTQLFQFHYTPTVSEPILPKP